MTNQYQSVIDFIRTFYQSKDSIPLHEPKFIGAVVNSGANIGCGTFVESNAVIKESVITKEFDFINAGSLFKGSVND
jgi:hypothetical protein